MPQHTVSEQLRNQVQPREALPAIAPAIPAAPGAAPTGAPTPPVAPTPAPTGGAPQAPAPAPGVPVSPAGVPATTAVQPFSAPPVNAENPFADLRTQMFLPGQSPDIMSLRALLGQNAQNLFNLPDRGELAQTYFDQFEEQNQRDLDSRVQDIGRDAARFGRIGSGVTTSRVGDAFAEAEGRRAQARERLAADAAGQTLSDRLGALTGAGGVESLLSGEGRADRAEGRQERDYAGGLEREALNNRIQQILLEDQLLGGQVNRGIQLGQYGWGTAPIQENFQAGGIYGDQAQGFFNSAGQAGAIGLDALLGGSPAFAGGGGGAAPAVSSVIPQWADRFAGSF